MVVVPMRADAVRLYHAIRAYVDAHGFADCASLVAFSGSLKLEDDGPEYTEPKLNGFSERELQPASLMRGLTTSTRAKCPRRSIGSW